MHPPLKNPIASFKFTHRLHSFFVPADDENEMTIADKKDEYFENKFSFVQLNQKSFGGTGFTDIFVLKIPTRTSIGSINL